ncbi:MAG: cell division ATP-binding protein FtsE [Longimicrobiaceae bacterium]
MIRFLSVSREYPRSGPALDKVSFHIRKGEFVFLTGHSGAGKSTVLRLIQMAERPSEGEVKVSGFSSRNVRSREIPQLRRRLGVVFQDFQLLPDRTAEENVSFALEVTGAKRSVISGRVNRHLAQVGLAHKAQALPEELSGGERQRVAVARALVNEPFVLLADEPTGNLDEWATKGIFNLFKEINATGTSIVMATHDLELVRAHPKIRVIELSEGQLVYDSTADKAGEG